MSDSIFSNTGFTGGEPKTSSDAGARGICVGDGAVTSGGAILSVS